MVSVMVWAAVSKSWKSPLTFIKQGTKPNINVYIEDILIPASQAMKKHFENKTSPSNKRVLLPTRPEKLKRGSEPIFRIFGARKCGPLLDLI